MTGDGLQDLVLVRNGNLAYWPNLGHGRWGPMVSMRRAPRLPDGHDPRRVLLGDLDGDGVADLVYVDDGRVLLWGNQSGNAWTEQPVTITGTPDVVDTDAIQLSDLHGTGMAGLLFSRAADGSGRPHLRFLDLTGGVKPYLLVAMDNQLGALTRVTYRPSTAEYLRDQADPATRWRTTLPFPVQVVSPGRGGRRDLRRPADHRSTATTTATGTAWSASSAASRWSSTSTPRPSRRPPQRCRRRIGGRAAGALLAADPDQELVPPGPGRGRRGRRLDRARPQPRVLARRPADAHPTSRADRRSWAG